MWLNLQRDSSFGSASKFDSFLALDVAIEVTAIHRILPGILTPPVHAIQQYWDISGTPR